MMKPIYSIIIPYKNCPALLNRCIDSIPQRDDVQIIVVDDNSDDDKKPNIIRNDVELVMLDAEHSKWAGRARNVGLERAKGKWLLFADADDCYTNYLPQLLDKYANDDATDIVYLNACCFDDDGVVVPLHINRFIKNYNKGKRGAEQDLRYGCWSPWTRMVKREMVVKNHIQFEETPVGNDTLFGLKVSMYSKSISIEKEIVYQYYKWPNGSITQKMREDMTEEPFVLCGKIFNFYNMVGYHSRINFWALVVSFIRKGKLTVKQAIQIYGKYLNQYDVFWGKDVLYGCYEVFQDFLCYGTRKVLKKADC